MNRELGSMLALEDGQFIALRPSPRQCSGFIADDEAEV